MNPKTEKIVVTETGILFYQRKSKEKIVDNVKNIENYCTNEQNLKVSIGTPRNK